MRKTMFSFRVRMPEARSFTPPEFYTGDSPFKSSSINSSDPPSTPFVPPHHANTSATLFQIPWKDVGISMGLLNAFRALLSDVYHGRHKDKLDTSKYPQFNGPLPVRKSMSWEPDTPADDPSKTIFATWLGHASYHVRIPVPNQKKQSVTYLNILTDPVFEESCSPFSGPKRITPCPTSVDKMRQQGEKARVDVIMISHNHYDHLSYQTIKQLITAPESKDSDSEWKPPTLFVPLGQKEWFKSQYPKPKSKEALSKPVFDPETDVHELDWWDEKIVELDNGGGKFSFVCTPAMHQSGRSLTLRDRFASLWCSWYIRAIGENKSSDDKSASVYFAGDTAYRSLLRENGEVVADYDLKNLDTPTPTTTTAGEPDIRNGTCPAFREIYNTLGAPRLSLLPIGAYEPRRGLSYVHASPMDSVQIHRDLHSRYSLAMHWATWKLTIEDVWDPARQLEAAKTKFKIPSNEFEICDIGQTVSVPL